MRLTMRMFGRHDNIDKRFISIIGLLTLYAVATTAYIFTFSPKFAFLADENQKAMNRAIDLEYKLRELTAVDGDTSFEILQRETLTGEKNIYLKRSSKPYFFRALDTELQKPSVVGGRLYGIREKDQGSALVHIDIAGEEKTVYGSANPTFNYIVHPYQPLLAFVANFGNEALVIRNYEEDRSIAGGEWYELSREVLEDMKPYDRKWGRPDISLISWTSDGEALWGSLNYKDNPYVFFRIPLSSDDIASYSAINLDLRGPYALNVDAGLILRWTRASTLNLYDLDLGEETVVATNVPPNPEIKWLSADTFEYIPAKGTTKIVQKI